MTNFTVAVEYNPETGEHYIPLPWELLDELGWMEGDTLEWTLNDDGTVTLTRTKLAETE
jgi:bifunctional DNA-binding transcriptional regulator/antitoxin component of YhaV-PrlF toxin-antitoxin module